MAAKSREPAGSNQSAAPTQAALDPNKLGRQDLTANDPDKEIAKPPTKLKSSSWTPPNSRFHPPAGPLIYHPTRRRPHPGHDVTGAPPA